ncbi:MAG: His/Gly/Thr/Pro-type tRNA ligase C-terminal domain-containing protein [Patescibacteria group bacterium]|nr:His/Gly/Thr/Pro-type tRNA ligase C-terminal domain-containing protein [Patescibacteria group bacterium]
MKQSLLFTKTKKEIPKDEESINARFLIRSGFIDKLMAGVYTFLPLGFRVLKKIENIIREEIKNLGAQEILMPSLHPKQNWQETGRWDTLDSLIKFATFYTKNEYALGPTHEEIVSPLMKNYIFSYKDLPTAVFQIQNKFRDEKRAKSGLLRGREFLMKDLYSFHKNEEELKEYYEKAKSVYAKIFEKIGLGDKTFLTFASGGTFSKYSHEFQTVSSAGEDVIYVCDNPERKRSASHGAGCKIAVNKEIINEQPECPQCGNKNLREEKAIEIGNIFELKTKYSTPFNLNYKDENGLEKEVIMGCYGIGLNRIMGTVVETYHDEKGIIWPKSIAPFSIHLINLKPDADFADRVYNNLQSRGIEVLYDDRKDITAGEKFADSDLIGIPLRAVISDKTEGKIEIKNRNETETKLINIDDIEKFVNNK